MERVLSDLAWHVEYKKTKREQAFKVYFFNERWSLRKGLSLLRLNLTRENKLVADADSFRHFSLCKKTIRTFQ